MKVCFVSPRLAAYLLPHYDKPAGGAQRQQSMVSQELSNRGYSVSAIVADYGQKSMEMQNGVKLVKGLPEKITGFLSVVRALSGLVWGMIMTSPDLYIVRGAPRLAAATFLFSRALQGRFVFRVANDSDADPSYLRGRYSSFFLSLYKRTVAGADAVIAQTERQRSLLKKNFGAESIRIPNGYDLPDTDELCPGEQRNHVLWVGSSDPEKKNPTLFLELAEQIPGLQFTMVSQPILANEEFHHELGEKASSIPNLNFVGTVPPDEIHDYYRESMLLVNTSQYEGFPNTFLEAWRYETPVVSLYFDLERLLERECGGVKAGTMENLVRIVEELASDPDCRAELGKSGRQHMKENYSLSRVVDLYEEAFDRALE
jgi:glycosyltransferase involved in cell wall biosynthesis